MEPQIPGPSNTNDKNNLNNKPQTSASTNLSLLPIIPLPFGPFFSAGLDNGSNTPDSIFRDKLEICSRLKFSSLESGSTNSKLRERRKYRQALVPYICQVPNERKLRTAASVANDELLKRLLDNGINPDSFDDHKRTALHVAASRGFKDIVKCLLLYRANPNIQDVVGNTPLHLAVCSANTYNFNMVVRTLLEHGARVDIKDRSGRTPLDLAVSKLHLMRQRIGPEASCTYDYKKMFVEMTMLTNILHKKFKEQHMKIDFDELENRLRNLSTKEIEVETDNLLGEVAKLSLH